MIEIKDDSLILLFTYSNCIILARYSKILVMPFVVVIGAVGYFMEQKFSTPKKIPYLDASVNEGREKRQMEIELDSEYGTPMDITKIKSKIVPESSLLLNTGRKGLIDNESRC
ncbi:unnamed protein product [Brugia timori]|uniref:Transmembrane protein n=2 Tax=Brugia TaxID=6278 RepID=A0A0R3QC74_9BILA|nr:unnamed protein product [Brugia timori]